MNADRGLGSLDTVREGLRRLVAEMMGLDELVPMLNALFGIRLPEDAALRAPTATDLARLVEEAWFGSGATADELVERIAALADE
ncbi:MAG: hypothetical protein ACRDSN_09035 [Pseudonocardiaceae bacterium]